MSYNIKKATALSLLRHAMTFIGGFAVAKGIIATEELEAITGAILTIFAVVFAYIEKKRIDKKINK